MTVVGEKELSGGDNGNTEKQINEEHQQQILQTEVQGLNRKILELNDLKEKSLT